MPYNQDVKMVDLYGQYRKIKKEIDRGIELTIENSAFIHGPAVAEFENHLAKYLNVSHVISCGNGTDALQIALMALGLERGDEVLVPAFTYVSSAEVIALLGLVPVLVDVSEKTFNVELFSEKSEAAISKRTKAIIPVHLFGQSCNMDAVMDFAKNHHLFVVEDNAQALGAKYISRNCRKKFTGTIGDIGCTSFFPTKNLGCYGDGGALMTDNEELASKIRMIANHGQEVKYHHKVIGCNSRLDTIQAGVLDVKLRHLDEYLSARYNAAGYYTKALKNIDPNGDFFTTPYESEYSTHTYHQYTLTVKNGQRDKLKQFLASRGVPSMIYYPLPLQEQEAYKSVSKIAEPLTNAEELSARVLSLPMHTELTHKMQDSVINAVKEFYNSCSK